MLLQSACAYRLYFGLLNRLSLAFLGPVTVQILEFFFFMKKATIHRGLIDTSGTISNDDGAIRNFVFEFFQNVRTFERNDYVYTNIGVSTARVYREPSVKCEKFRTRKTAKQLIFNSRSENRSNAFKLSSHESVRNFRFKRGRYQC